MKIHEKDLKRPPKVYQMGIRRTLGSNQQVEIFEDFKLKIQIEVLMKIWLFQLELKIDWSPNFIFNDYDKLTLRVLNKIQLKGTIH